ncbi:MAG: riboflavin biosynthesis protein RibF [Lachnospiraceae bacterium]|nr:riboflavin biosynthesis protein RibF [Lachnospiraceae bacterium]
MKMIDICDLRGTDEPISLTIGKFDGIHVGHQQLIAAMRKTGLPMAMLSVCIPGAEELLTQEESAMAAEAMGIELFVRMPLTDDTKSMTPEAFLRDICIGKCNAQVIVVGENFRFGQGRTGDAKMLAKLAEEMGIRCIVCPMIREDGEDVSSTRLRTLLSEGDIVTLNRMLGYAYPVHGIVMRGKRIGHELRFPTVNLYPPAEKLLPPFGVYRTRTRVGENEYVSVTNVGNNPTVRDGLVHGITVETHIPGIAEELYGSEITVSFYERIRGQKKFGSLAELSDQLALDTETALAKAADDKNVQIFPAFFEK